VGTALAVADITLKTIKSTEEEGALMGVAQAGKTPVKHATAMLWFAIGAAVAVTAFTGGLAAPLAAAALGTQVATGGTYATHNMIDQSTPHLL